MGWEDTTAGKSFAFHVVDLGLTPKHHIIPKHYQKLPSVEPRLSTDFRWVWPLPPPTKKKNEKKRKKSGQKFDSLNFGVNIFKFYGKQVSYFINAQIHNERDMLSIYHKTCSFNIEHISMESLTGSRHGKAYTI